VSGSTGLAPGLCSVTLRQLGIAEVVDRAAAAGLAGIEWGADVHVPPGDEAAAASAARLTADAGLRVASYGSYLFADENGPSAAGPVFDSAGALGAGLVRIWCPFAVEPGCGAPERAAVADVLAVLAAAAASQGITLYLEFHAATLTATATSALALVEEVGVENLLTAWQPPYWDPVALGRGPASDVADLALLAPRLAHLHVYEWSTDLERHPLAAGEGHWPAALAAASAAPGRPEFDRFALLEFVAGDDPDALAADAATLRRWLA